MKTNRGNVNPNERYGRLLTIRLHGHNKEGRALWECSCECGNTKIALSKTLRNGMTRSCGCVRGDAKKTHGGSDTPAYYRWRNMLNRCYYKHGKDYQNYGARGITVCSRWRAFKNFLADMGKPPFHGATIERRDNNKNYEPDNCYWANRTTQARNRRNAVVVIFNGQRHPIIEWAKITGIKPHTIEARLGKGWTVHRALTVPARGIHHGKNCQ